MHGRANLRSQIPPNTIFHAYSNYVNSANLPTVCASAPYHLNEPVRWNYGVRLLMVVTHPRPVLVPLDESDPRPGLTYVTSDRGYTSLTLDLVSYM